LERLPQVTAETWAAALWESFEQKRADIQEQLDSLDPWDHKERIAYNKLSWQIERELTILMERLGVISQTPQQELAIVRIMRTMQQLPRESLAEIHGAIGNEEAFAKVFQKHVQEPLAVIGSTEVHEVDEGEDDLPVAAEA